jgi:hypothetical protein
MNELLGMSTLEFLAPFNKLPTFCMRKLKLRVGEPTLVTKLLSPRAETQTGLHLFWVPDIRWMMALQGFLEVNKEDWK